MRILHCTVALLLVAGLAGAQTAAVGQNPAHFTVFIRGAAIGTEEVTVTRSADGLAITGTARLGPPIVLTVRRAEIRYGADGAPQRCTIEGSIQEKLLGIHTTVTGTTATTDYTEGLQNDRKTQQVSPNALLAPNVFFGSYEAMAARVLSMKVGDELRMYIPPQAELPVKITSVGDETIRTPAGAVKGRRVGIQIQNPGRPLDAEVWADTSGRLLRLVVPAQSLDYARNDIVSVASRREPVSHPNDEQVSIPANGFNLAGTLSKPVAKVAKGTRLPAIVLVAGAGEADRDETTAGVPVFGQLASSLADAGFMVLRYDRRGIGQSGGRVESVTLQDYAEDVRMAVAALRKRKDVDRKRIAVAGYAEGGLVAMLAAQQDDDVKALVLLNAPGINGADLVLERQARTLSSMNIPEAEKKARVDLQKKINQAVLSGRGWTDVPPAVRKQADTPWFRSFLAFDPSKVLPKTDQPVLIVTAALDREVLPANGQKLEAMARGRKKRAGQAVKRVEVPGVNHLFLPATTGEVDEYAKTADKTIDRQVPAGIAAWLKEAWARK